MYQMGKKRSAYLGYVMGGEEVIPQGDKTEAVRRCEVPRTKKDVRVFLGSSGFYRHFIPHYLVIAAVLTDLTRKGRPARVKWKEEYGEVFVKLKATLSGGPVLHSPDYDHEFIVQTDASDRGMGAVLCQVDENR